MNHRTLGVWPFCAARSGLVDVDRLPAQVGRAPQRVAQHPRADRVVGDAVDEDERARLAVVVVGVEGDLAVELEVADPDLVELELGRGEVLARVDVELVLQRRDRRGGDLRADPHQVVAPAVHRVVGHPHDRRLELVGDAGRGLGGRDHVAAAGVDLVGERERHGLAGDRGVEVAVVGHDPLDPAAAVARQHADLVAGAHGAAGDRAGEAAEVRARAAHPLHGHPERRALHAVEVDLDLLEVAQQRRPVVPGHALARLDHVVARQRGDRDAGDVGQADLGARTRGRPPRSRGSAPRSARRGPSC